MRQTRHLHFHRQGRARQAERGPIGVEVNQNSFAKLKVGFSTIAVNGQLTLSPCSQDRHYHYLGATYTNMAASFPAFYAWVKASGLAVSMTSYARVEGFCGRYRLDESTDAVLMPTLAANVFGATPASVAETSEFVVLLGGKAGANLENMTAEGKVAAVGWGMPDCTEG